MSNGDVEFEPMDCPTPGFGIFETNWGKPKEAMKPLHNTDTPPEITSCS